MWGFAFEKKNVKAPYPYRKKNDLNSFLFFLIYEAQIILNILLFATTQYEREGLLTKCFLSEYNAKRISDMKRN